MKCKDCGGSGEKRTARTRGGTKIYGPPQISPCFTCNRTGEVDDNRVDTAKEMFSGAVYVDINGFLKKNKRAMI